FSSDIDLIFAFPEAGDTRDGPRTITNEQFFTRLGRRLLSLLGEVTAEGPMFRVDMRLRPYGESGPLVMSFDAMVAYYQREGREWERYAWIKARVVAGDRTAGRELLEKLKPFVYRRYLDYGVFEALREMKAKITQEVRRKGLRDNIKIGPGGIREIEFFGQIFQLRRGGVTPALQEPRIQTVLGLLARQQLISDASRQALIEAYVFLRNTEHRLQEFGDQQTHDLPQDPVGRLRMAAGMGFEDWESFAARLKKHREGVHDHFNGLLGAREVETAAQQTDEDLVGVWLQSFDPAHSRQVLRRIGFEAADEALRLLEVLRNDAATRSLSDQGRRRLDRLMPMILTASGRSQNPLTALGRTLDLLKTIQQRTCYIALLLENPTALAHLVRLTHTSPWVVSYLSQHPVLLDELLDPRSLYDPMQREQLHQELAQQLAPIDAADLEYLIEQLCVFKQVNTLRIASIDVSGTLPLMRVSDHLSDIAEIILEAVQQASWRHLTAKHGTPQCLLDGERFARGFAVVAYGKLGGIELSYDSDLDLVFLHAAAPGQTNGGNLPI
ncbi:MAG: bifunctional [glutamate--ammonia ligase]-adenylyl-L-tyrosine phosphorylase/[glutamate--ammonia-ligase] adenylyltransferase, partial [Desulfobacterales bacterium]|nr:bifunctional [glutamate--ammonia ligase]-adenylyl-L-tyrosine phosphorylase/[glutamate--ammonia-ligase] adenylyltransferase [Desulfobacterales bacterium]